MPNGYDFSEDEQEIEAQRDAAQRDAEQAEKDWVTLDEKTMASELNGLNSRLCVCVKALSTVLLENDYIATRDLLRTLMQKDLGPAGWICSFYETNKEAFSKAKGLNHPDWVNGLRPDEIKLYDTALKYYRDVEYLRMVSLRTFAMLTGLPLADGFKIVQLEHNMDDAGFNEAFYKKIDNDVFNIHVLLNSPWAALEPGAREAKQYFERNEGRLKDSELEKGYRAARLADYRELLKVGGVSYFLAERSGGLAYSVDPRRLAAMRVIDSYTREIVKMRDLIEPTQKIVDACKKIVTEDLAEAEKHCTTQAAQFLCAAFHEFVEKVSDVAEYSQSTYRAFKEKQLSGAYCWMRKLSNLDAVKPKYEFNPSTNEPWDDGTHYEIMFRDAARAVGSHARAFAYDHGEMVD